MTGRFWNASPDTTYQAKVEVIGEERAGKLVVEIVRPGGLGSSRHEVLTVESDDRRLNLDSLLFVWSGRYGIPPQFLKGQIDQESNFDEDLRAYTPSYRYEPLWNRHRNVVDYFTGNPFYVTREPPSMGTGNPVPDHANVRDIPYPTEPRTAWWYIAQYSPITTGGAPPGGIRLYVQIAGGLLRFPNNPPLQRTYHRILRAARMQNPETAADSARVQVGRYLRDVYNGGLDRVTAQTRIAASYGLGQLLYTTAILPPCSLDRQNVACGIGYPVHQGQTPEQLNELDTALRSYLDLYENYLQQVTGEESLRTAVEWEEGFERTFREIYDLWNDRGNYPDEVLRRVPNFLPTR